MSISARHVYTGGSDYHFYMKKDSGAKRIIKTVYYIVVNTVLSVKTRSENYIIIIIIHLLIFYRPPRKQTTTAHPLYIMQIYDHLYVVVDTARRINAFFLPIDVQSRCIRTHVKY